MYGSLVLTLGVGDTQEDLLNTLDHVLRSAGVDICVKTETGVCVRILKESLVCMLIVTGAT